MFLRGATKISTQHSGANLLLREGVTGEICERFVRDQNHLSHAPTPLYKGVLKDLVRD